MSTENSKQEWTCPTCGSLCRGDQPNLQAAVYDDPYAEERGELADTAAKSNERRTS